VTSLNSKKALPSLAANELLKTQERIMQIAILFVIYFSKFWNLFVF